MKNPYDEKAERQMLAYYGTLSEKDRRQYAVVEATKLGRGGQSLGIRIIVCHYPLYCSKYNPIEYRLFAPIHRNWQGGVFKSYGLVKELVESTTTEKGQVVVARIVYKEYPPGICCSKEELPANRILPHEKLPDLSYTILPD